MNQRLLRLALLSSLLAAGCASESPLDASTATVTARAEARPFPPQDQLLLETRNVGDDAAPFVAPALPKTSEPSQTRTAPAPKVRQVSLTRRDSRIIANFDQAMTTFRGERSLDDLAGVHITPRVEGRARWSTPRQLSIDLPQPLRRASRFEVRFAGEAPLRSAAGVALEAHATHVSTRTVRVSGPYSYRLSPRQFQRDDWVPLYFDQPVTERALRESLTLTDGPDDGTDGGVNVPIRLQVSDKGDGTRVMIAPRGGFEIGHTYRLDVAAGLDSGGELGMTNPWTLYLAGPKPLSVSYVGCGYDDCRAKVPWRVTFNNPLRKDTAESCVSITPALADATWSQRDNIVVIDPGPVAVGATYTIGFSASCEDINGSQLGRPVRRLVTVHPPLAHLSMAAGNGYLSPVKSAAVLPIEARDTGPLSITTRRVHPADVGTFIKHGLSEWGGFHAGNLANHLKATGTTSRVTPTDDEPLHFPLDSALGGESRGVLLVGVTATNNASYDEPPRRQALIQVTDTGLTAKVGAQGTLVWATRISDATPQQGVQVSLYSAAGAKLWDGVTNAHGLASAPGSASFGNTPPRAVAAFSPDGDLTIVDLKDHQTEVSAYRHNLVVDHDPQERQLRGFVFTERGVYRPGESVHVKGYIRLDQDKGLTPLPGSSVDVEVVNALDESLLRETVTLGPVGDFDLTVPLDTQAPLGSYAVNVRSAQVGADAITGKAIGRFRVEAYRANRFEVVMETTSSDATSDLSASIVGRYLYGAPMPEAPFRWYARKEAATFSASRFRGFRFAPLDPVRWWRASERSAEHLGDGDGELDASGRANVTINLADAQSDTPPVVGMSRVVIESEVTDVDAQTVAGRSVTVIHPGDFYLGIDAGARVTKAGQPFTARVVAVTPTGAPTQADNVVVKLERRTYKSVRENAAGGGYTWRTTPITETVATRHLNLTRTGAQSVDFTPPTSGSYRVVAAATDSKGRQIQTGDWLWTWGGDDAGWARTDGGTLDLIADKDAYNVGDEATVLVQNPFGEAHALVTVERHGILHQEVIALEGSAPAIRVPITESMMPNAYLSVVVVRGQLGDATVQDAAKARSRVGYAELSVSLDTKRLTVEIAPEQTQYRPGERLSASVTVKDAKGRPVSGQVTFMAVDEGVLSLTGYRTPDPVAGLYQTKGLGVRTSDIRKRLWAQVKPLSGQMKADWGGGGDEGGEATVYRSAFATTAAFLPDVEVGSDGQAQVSFDLPDNLGAFRLMAVAATRPRQDSGSAFGGSDTRIEVSKPLLVRPALPRFVSAGDRVQLRAVVQSLDGIAAATRVRALVAGPLELVGDDQQTLELVAGRATTVTFDAVATGVGDATVAFEVVRDGESSTKDAVEVTVPIQFPAAVETAVETGRVGDTGDSDAALARTIEIPDWMHDEVGELSIEVVPSAMGQLLPGLDYLMGYPYGCVEQTTGGTLPLLALRQLKGAELELPGLSASDIVRFAQSGVDRLKTMQTASGGLGYWPGAGDPHPWGSVYGGMALITAKRAGLDVGDRVVNELTGYLSEILRGRADADQAEWRREIEVVKPFAAFVLALAGKAERAFHAQLFDRRTAMPAFSRSLLAMAVAESDPDATMAQTLIDELVASVDQDARTARLRNRDTKRYHSTMDSDVRSTALLLMALGRVRPTDPLNHKLARGLLDERRGGRWASTQENGFAILALSDYFARTEGGGQAIAATVRLGDRELLNTTLAAGALTPKRIRVPMAEMRKANGKLLTIERRGAGPLYYSLSLAYAPETSPATPVGRGFHLTRDYRYAEGPRQGEVVTKLEVGELVEVTLQVSTHATRRYVAIDDPLPAGLEPIGTGFDTTSRRFDGNVTEGVFSHAEQRDDRIQLFSDHMRDGSYSHTYMARATTRGVFAVPAARVHEMYDPTVFGTTAPSQLVVN